MMKLGWLYINLYVCIPKRLGILSFGDIRQHTSFYNLRHNAFIDTNVLHFGNIEIIEEYS